MEDGNIEYLGRIDSQIKIRRYRIELGEIESIIRKYICVNEVVVTDFTDSDENKFLCAYIVSDGNINIKELREYLLKYLLDYMILTYYMLIDEIPLTQNKKVNRNALPESSINNFFREEYEAPKGVKFSKIENYNKRGVIKYYKYINKKILRLIQGGTLWIQR